MNEIRSRKPVVALVMSAVLPGFGQLYNGAVNRGIWLFIAFLFLNVPWLAVLALYLPGGLVVPTLLLTFAASLAIWIYGMVDAWRHAKIQQDYAPERWQASGMYVLVFIVCNVVAFPVLTLYVRAHLFEPFRIPSASMEPSVLRGDYLIADKRYNCPGCKFRIEQGDVAIFAEPNDRTRLSIKRIIGLPGDRVTIDGMTVEVNGEPLRDASSSDTSSRDASGGTVRVTESVDDREWTVQWDPTRLPGAGVDLTVPPGQIFVLGDNRSASLDSRQLGAVSLEDVVGRARQIWFSWGDDGIRWERFGMIVR